MRGRIPSPLQSAWAFFGWVVFLFAPVWKLVSFAGNVDFMVNRADEIAAIVSSLPGTLLLMVAGLGLLYYANRKELSGGLEEKVTLESDVEKPHSDLPEGWVPDGQWGNAPTKAIIGKSFQNETVELDGRSYTGCKFVNCTFVYRGRQPFDMAGNEVVGTRRILVQSSRVHNFVQLLHQWDFIDPEVDDNEISQ